MPIIAIWPIRNNGTKFAPGELIEGLTHEEEERFIREGFAHRPITVSGINAPLLVTLPPVDALRNLLKNMAKKDLVKIAEHLDVEANEKMKNSDILDLIVADAEERGVDLEALSDEQLATYADLLGVDPVGNRDELMDSIDSHIKENEL